MALRTLSAKSAAALDQELMSTGGFSIDQLMELAGLSVSQALYKLHPPSQGKRILIACGPGNNGGDGLVAARHLHHYGYHPTVYYPKRPSSPLYTRLCTQLSTLSIPFTTDFPLALTTTDYIIDALFGFSFVPPIRAPFPPIISLLSSTRIPILAVDIPSSWGVEDGMPESGVGSGYVPGAVVSLTAPKMGVRGFGGRHFVGGRFLGGEVAERYGVDVPGYEGVEQVVEVAVE
ncbi:meiotically up-regulated gene 182 protein, partial [Polyplosphaeria fusca]